MGLDDLAERLNQYNAAAEAEAQKQAEIRERVRLQEEARKEKLDALVANILTPTIDKAIAKVPLPAPLVETEANTFSMDGQSFRNLASLWFQHLDPKVRQRPKVSDYVITFATNDRHYPTIYACVTSGQPRKHEAERTIDPEKYERIGQLVLGTATKEQAEQLVTDALKKLFPGIFATVRRSP